MPASKSKADLYRGGSSSTDITTNQNFELRNNAGNTYFNIEGQNGTALFNTATITSLVNCSVVSGSMSAGFSVNGMSTASFTLNLGGVTIAKENIRFIATNSKVYSTGDSTASGSFFGIDFLRSNA